MTVDTAPYTAQIAAAEKAYVLASAAASAAYSTGALSAWTTYVTAATNAGVSYDTAMKAANDGFTNSENDAWRDYVNKADTIDGAYAYALNALNNNPNFNAAGYILAAANGSGSNINYGIVAFGGEGEGVTSVDFETEERLFGLKNRISRISDIARFMAWFTPAPAMVKMQIDMQEAGAHAGVDEVIIVNRQIKQGSSLLQTAYVGLGMPLANLTGVAGASYFYDGTDPVSGRQLSGVERNVHGTLGVIQLATIGVGGAKLIVPQPGPAMGAQTTVSNVASSAKKRSTVTVYRVESPGNQRIAIDELTGGVEVLPNRNTLFLNFGDEGRAMKFKQRRLDQGYEGTVIKEFQVMDDTLQQLRNQAVRERNVPKFPDSPLQVDIKQAPDQFGLRSAHIEDLLENIIQGTGKVRK